MDDEPTFGTELQSDRTAQPGLHFFAFLARSRHVDKTVGEGQVVAHGDLLINPLIGDRKIKNVRETFFPSHSSIFTGAFKLERRHHIESREVACVERHDFFDLAGTNRFCEVIEEALDLKLFGRRHGYRAPFEIFARLGFRTDFKGIHCTLLHRELIAGSLRRIARKAKFMIEMCKTRTYDFDIGGLSVRIFTVVFLFFLLTAPNLIFAQTPAASEVSCHPVKIGLEEVFCIEKGIGSFTAEERADAVQVRLRRLVKESALDLSRLSTLSHETTVDLLFQDVVIANFTEADAKSNKVDSAQTLAENAIAKIQNAAKREREAMTANSLFSGIIYTLIATLVLIVILTAFSFAYPKVYERIENSKGNLIRSLRIQSFEILTADRIVETLSWLAQVSRLLLTLLVFYIYVPLVLSQFPMTADWSPRILGYIVDPLQQLGGVVIEYIPKLFFLAVIWFATRFLLRVVRFFFLEIERGSIRFHGFYKEWAQPTYKLVRFFIFAFALVMAFPYIPGSSSPAFQGVTVFLGILVSFGSSSAIGNIVSGIVLTYMRPYKIGDRVKIADTMGDITEKNLLITRVRTIKNVDVTIPNTMVLGSHIVNYSSTAASKGLILNTTVTLGYDISWQTAHKLLIEAAERTDKILATPKPFILQTALNDFAVAYELNAYTNHPNDMADIYSDLHRNVHDRFNQEGVEIISPHFMALRDGNTMMVPEKDRAADYRVPAFRVKDVTE